MAMKARLAWLIVFLILAAAGQAGRRGAWRAAAELRSLSARARDSLRDALKEERPAVQRCCSEAWPCWGWYPYRWRYEERWTTYYPAPAPAPAPASHADAGSRTLVVTPEADLRISPSVNAGRLVKLGRRR